VAATSGFVILDSDPCLAVAGALHYLPVVQLVYGQQTGQARERAMTEPGSNPASVAMMQRDRASGMLGMTVVVNLPGRAVVTMAIRDDMLNGFDITHGGFVFALADTAFAIACNDDDATTVSSGAEITYLKSTSSGETLTATAERRSTAGRSGVFDVTITDEAGDVVAEFRGHSRKLPARAASPVG
jgi:acyl-CoA thioesterase